MMFRLKSNPKDPILATRTPPVFLDGYLFFLLDLGLEKCCEQHMSGSSLVKLGFWLFGG